MKKFTLLIAFRLKVFLLLLNGIFFCQIISAREGPLNLSGFVDITVKGKVSNKDGPLIGVSVKVDGSTAGTSTDENGNYSISVPENGTLIFSYVGYKEQRIAVKSQAVINITLVADPGQLETVIVTGYRTQTRGTITGSVSSVNSSEFADIPVDNLSNALAGRLSGATIVQAAGTPGMESSIRIRAIGTRNNADPLYVIDGIISDKFAFDGLSPNEVEAITILKDGASAAIYGSRAANGVILVTTKRGKEGPPRLSYSGIYAVQTPTKIPETLDAYDHAKQINHQLQYNKVPVTDARYYSADELEYFKAHSWNWVDEMWKDPQTTQHTLDVSGGAKNIKYFLGGSYNYASGSFNNINFRKYTLRGNMDVSVTNNLKLTLDLNTDTRATNGPSWDVNNWRMEDLYKALLFRSKMVPPYVNGLPVGNWVEWHPGVVLTPEVSGYNKREWTGLNANVALNYTFRAIRGLSARVSFNRYTRDIFNKQFNLPYNMTVFNTTGTNNHIVGDQPVGLRPRAATEFLLERQDKNQRYQFNAQLNYKRNFGKHNVDALFVYEQSEEKGRWFNGRRDDFISPSVDQFAAGSTVNSTVGGSEDELGRLSYVGIASYNYAQKYLLEGSFRLDASSAFSPQNRWGFFPSVSAGWRISEEPFFKNKFFNDLKLRASVGLLGNDAVVIYQWVQTYAIRNGAIFTDPTVGIQPGVLANPNITWEKSLNYNAGLDARFLDNKMNFKLDLFFRHTYDILYPREATFPDTYAAPLASENWQEMDAKGIELELGFNGDAGSSKNKINYYARGNFGFATNEWVVYNEPDNIRPYLSRIGRPTGMIFGYIATGVLRTQKDLDALPQGYTILGVQPQLGMLNYKDIRGPNSEQPDGRITSDDREFIAKYNSPPANFGLSLGGSWRSLSLDMLFQGFAGGKSMLPTTGRDIQARAEEASFAYWADSWSPDNANGKYPGYRVSGYRTRFDESTFFLVDNSFVRLKNITLSYGLPESITNRVKIKNARVFFTGTNLLMIYSANKLYDPEMNNITSYPMMKNYSFGLNIGL